MIVNIFCECHYFIPIAKWCNVDVIFCVDGARWNDVITQVHAGNHVALRTDK